MDIKRINQADRKGITRVSKVPRNPPSLIEDPEERKEKRLDKASQLLQE